MKKMPRVLPFWLGNNGYVYRLYAVFVNERPILWALRTVSDESDAAELYLKPKNVVNIVHIHKKNGRKYQQV